MKPLAGVVCVVVDVSVLLFTRLFFIQELLSQRSQIRRIVKCSFTQILNNVENLGSEEMGLGLGSRKRFGVNRELRVHFKVRIFLKSGLKSQKSDLPLRT